MSDNDIPGIHRFFTEEEYDKLLSTGMFWVIFPEFTGSYSEDLEIFLREKGTENNNNKANDNQ